eukprot:GFUD01043915.1.p1 GENE.GFUD01043915.1~~GFUD01043915.1.p1  ORF type:complete len:1327 (+),score=371.71 GFUD01043915.1:99-4079(+)
MGERWWEAKVLEVDTEGCEVLVHFTGSAGWNGRHDEWIKMDSPRLQPLHRRSRRFSSGPSQDTDQPHTPPQATIPPPSIQTPGPSNTPQTSSHYSVGEEVLALWKQSRKYPATILDLQGESGYLVRFYDGFEKVVRGQCIRRVGKGDIEFVSQCKEQLSNGGGDDEESLIVKDNSAECEAESPPCKVRRERKSKFNVREILNLKETSPKKSGLKAANPRTRTSSSDGFDKAAFPLSDKVFDETKVVAESGDELKDIILPEAKEDANSNDSSDCGKVIEVVDLSESLDFKSENSVSETGSEGTPSEKENINCDVDIIKNRSKTLSRDPIFESLAPEVRTKRARKRKKFADEEPESPLSKVSKKSALHMSILKSKPPRVPKPEGSIPHILSKRNSESSKKRPRDKSKTGPDLDSDKSKSEIVSSRNVVKSPQNNNSNTSSDSFTYLSFDFSLPPDQIYSKLVEGVNVPGAKKPILMKSPKLPIGWVKKVLLRTVGNSKWDVLIENSEGKSFKSRAELSRYFEENSLEHNLEHFDFALDTPLKKLRQVWRANLPQVDSLNKTTVSNGVKEDTIDLSSSNERLQPPGELNNKTDPVDPELKQQPKKPLKAPASSPDKLKLEIFPHSITNSSLCLNFSSPIPSLSNSKATPILQTPSSPIKGTLSETGQGVRCPLKNCNKLFRNEKLLQMHVKHYHPEFNSLVGNSPSVTDLAFHRTRLGEDFKELESGGILLENLRKAEKVVERQHILTQHGVTGLTEAKCGKLTEISSDKQAEPCDLQKYDDGLIETLAESVKPDAAPEPIERNETDGPIADAGLLSETDCLRVDVEDSLVPSPAGHPLPETPRLTGPKARPKRLRNDSILSVGSETVFTPPPSPLGCGATLPTSSLPLTYKMSRRRAQQLRSAPTTPPGELKDATETTETTETMSEGEVVHCLCAHPEGDGMMVQCESCLTWQHGQCVGVEGEGQVPDKYICTVCLAPSLGRQSALYSLDMDWVREGKLAGLRSKVGDKNNMLEVVGAEKELKTLSDLMADLINLSAVLHSLQVKLAVAGQRNNPKVFMWSNVWEEVEGEPAILGFSTDINHMEFLKKCDKSAPLAMMGAKNGLRNRVDPKVVNGDVIDEFFDGKYEKSGESCDSEVKLIEDNSLIKPVSSSREVISGQKQEDISGNFPSDSQSTKKLEPSESQSFGTDLAEYFSGEGFDFPSSLLPTVSEMQRLLPGVIKDISGFSSQNFGPATLLPSAPNIIPEPKRLDREECRLNLVLHIENLQKLVQARMEDVEEQVDLLESKSGVSEQECSNSTVLDLASPLASTLQDLRSAKRLNCCLPDRI